MSWSYWPRVIWKFMCKQCNKRLSRWLSGKESACQCRRSGEVGSVPESGRSPGEEIDNPLQCSCLENSKQKQGSLAGYSPWGCKRVGHSLVTSLSFLLSGSDGKVSAYSTGDLGSIPGLGRSPGEGNGYPHGIPWTEEPQFNFR